MTHSKIIAALPVCLLSASLLAQGPISGFKPPKGEIALAINYAIDSYDRYFLAEGSERRSLDVQSYSLFVEAATGNNTSLVATLPYLSVDPDNRGLQDASIWLKYANLQSIKPHGLHNVFTAIGLSFPVGNYATGVPESIGQRATVFQGRLAYQYQHQSGWFISAISGIDFQLSPDSRAAWPFLLRTGYGGSFFYVEGWVETVRSLDGDAGVQSALSGTGSSWNRLGTTLYVPITPWLGINAGGAWIVGGKFIGASSRYNIGTVFKLQSGK